MNETLVKTEGVATPAKLLELAISKDIDIEKLEKLLALQERWDANQAKKSFLIAMSDFQSKCPDFQKGKQVDFTTKSGFRIKYNYTPLGVIAQGIKEALKECGLSYRWETQENDKISITCIVSHIDGHSERNTMSADKDASGNKNDIQQIGSTMTYLQRYTLVGALAISSADQDADGEQPKKEEVRRSKTESDVLLQNAMKVIDDYENADDLQSNAKPILNQQVEKGMHTADCDKLKKYINAQYESLKPEKK